MNRRFPGAVVIALCIAQLPLAAHSAETEKETTVIVVRHAEKALNDMDPVLSEAGRSRAAALAHVLGETDIDAIYTTQYLRTRQTAEPLATKRGMKATVIEASATHVADLATKIRTEHRGDTVLVVGHSNTVPEILAALGAANPPGIADHEYDGFYILTIGADGTARLLALRYGAET